MPAFYNQATLSFNGNNINSNITAGEIVEALTANKTAVVPVYSRDGDVTYVVTLVNSGSSALNGLTVTDDLGAYPFGTGNAVPLDYKTGSVRLFVNGVLQSSPNVESTSPLVFTGINVPANGSALLIYEADVNEFAPPAAGSTITNTAVTSCTGIAPVTVSETITAEDLPRLSVFKSLFPSVVTENGEVTYTFTIQNTGSASTDPTDSLFITDTFDPVLTDIRVTLNGEPLSEDDYSYSEETGVFTTSAGVISVPAASFSQDETTGVWTSSPGIVIITITGRLRA